MAESLPSFISKQVIDSSYFFLDLVPKASDDFVVSCGGMEKCTPDYRLRRDAFGYLGIEYVVSGRARVTIGEEEFELRPGSLFGYKPNTELTIENGGVYPLTKCFVDLQGKRALSIFESSPLGKLQPLEFAGVRWIGETFRQMIKFGSRGGKKAERSCAMLAELLLIQIEESEQEKRVSQTPAFLSYQSCRRAIEETYESLNSIAELAERVNLDQAYIARLFKRYDEEAPYKKLVRLKMNHAARILLRENMPVKAVAGMVGFDDVAHFSRVFKNTYGVSPANFLPTVRRR